MSDLLFDFAYSSVYVPRAAVLLCLSLLLVFGWLWYYRQRKEFHIVAFAAVVLCMVWSGLCLIISDWSLYWLPADVTTILGSFFATVLQPLPFMVAVWFIFFVIFCGPGFLLIGSFAVFLSSVLSNCCASYGPWSRRRTVLCVSLLLGLVWTLYSLLWWGGTMWTNGVWP